MQIQPIRCPLFKENGSLETYISKIIPVLRNSDILVITSKIVALSQGRIVENGPGRKSNVIREESEQVIKTKWCYLTLKDGHWCPNAGVDESNARGKLILWPTDSYLVAAEMRKTLMKKFKLKKLGILITDSRTFPLRSGVTGVALGYAGFKGLRDYRGKRDLFKRKLIMTQTNVADSLATAAVLLMGEGNERQPLCLIKEAPVVFTSMIDRKELRIEAEEDMYRPMFESLEK
ncbi:coenzyme F420-0:L-glutamate ligase [Candidatus Uhrbacteria bacterium]|nr:coenzyme F420-0:L-glutamate ligase [Candidatus Uhrbacteria bacterium]